VSALRKKFYAVLVCSAVALPTGVVVASGRDTEAIDRLFARKFRNRAIEVRRRRRRMPLEQWCAIWPCL
jgi:hypothetical protein